MNKSVTIGSCVGKVVRVVRLLEGAEEYRLLAWADSINRSMVICINLYDLSLVGEFYADRTLSYCGYEVVADSLKEAFQKELIK